MTSYERLLISRYLLPGRAGRFAVLIAAIGCAGVAIGVASLVLVLGFMNGVEARLGGQIASADGHVVVTRRNALGTWSGLERKLRRRDGVASATASLEARAWITAGGRSVDAELQGVAPADMSTIPALEPAGTTLIGRAPVRPGTVALGTDLARRLGVGPGDHIAVTVPRMTGGNLDVRNFDAQVSGVVTTGAERFDARRALMPIGDLRSHTGLGASADRISLWLDHPDRPDTVDALRRWLGPDMVVRTWREMNRSLVIALAQERLAMTAIISLVTLIALSNITSSMVMYVRHKTREIAILRTIGMTRSSIAKVFVGVGAVIGLVGEVAGLCLGFGLKVAKDPLAEAVSSRMAHPPIELDVFLSLPLTVSAGQTVGIVTLVSAGIVLSTLYPALWAAAVEPAAALRYI